MKRVISYMAALGFVAVSGCAVLLEVKPPYTTTKKAANADDKIAVCHKGKKTIYISRAALDAHLKHGDYRGHCR